MAVPSLTFVPRQTSAPTDNTTPLDEIPQDVRDQVEEVYKALSSMTETCTRSLTASRTCFDGRS